MINSSKNAKQHANHLHHSTGRGLRLTNEPVHEGGWLWHVLADPDGNEFCVLQPPMDHWS